MFDGWLNTNQIRLNRDVSQQLARLDFWLP